MNKMLKKDISGASQTIKQVSWEESDFLVILNCVINVV